MNSIEEAMFFEADVMDTKVTDIYLAVKNCKTKHLSSISSLLCTGQCPQELQKPLKSFSFRNIRKEGRFHPWPFWR